MSKALKTVGTVLGAVALVATGVGAIGGIALATKIGAIAGVASGIANIGSSITAPKPVARGSITNVLIEPEPPRPYMVGESFSAGVLRHQAGYGATIKKVPNPYLLQVKVFSGVGPVEALVQEQFDFKAIGSYYSGFYDSDTQLGARPEASALVPPYGAAPGWNASSKLSGHAGIASNYKFDKEGKVYASGLPIHGAIWKGEKAYDPRLDSTYPGGSGSHRLGDETTYTYTANPAIHTGTYAYGRFEDGELIFGLGLDETGIDWAALVDWANDCDANGWECHGTLWEGGKNNDIEAQRVQNMDDLCAAGGGRWLLAGALLSFDWQRPRVPLATLTDDDWLEEGATATAVQAVRDRMNGVRPVYISPAHNWEQITAEEIIGASYRTEDGKPLTHTWPLNLVKTASQAGELASYALVDSREIGPITINAKSEWRFYKPGETITIDSDMLGYTGPAVIMSRDLDPSTFAVKLTLKTETTDKHDFALGKVAVPPPTPVVGQTGEERDNIATGATDRQITIDPIPDYQIQASSTGETTTDLPEERTVVLRNGGSILTTGVVFSMESVPAGITAAIGASTGVLSLTAASAPGDLIVKAVYGGNDYFTSVKVDRRASYPVAGGGTGAISFIDSEWINISTTSDVQITDLDAIVQSNASGEIRYSAGALYSGTGQAILTLQYSLDGVSWDYFISPTTGTFADAGTQGYVGFSAATKTGLTPSTDYYVRALGRRAALSGTLSWISPNASFYQP